MRVARAVVEGDGGRGPRLRREGWGGCGCCFDGVGGWWVWVGGERSAEALLGESWAWLEVRGRPIGAWLGCWLVVLVVGVKDP
jgi:hypothetical protein